MTVLIDSNEPQKIKVAALDACEEPRVKDLPVGDFWVGDCFAERKTYADFVGRMTDSEISIWRQLRSLKNINDGDCFPVLILEGSTRHSRLHSGVKRSSVLGALRAVCEMGIHIIPTNGATDTGVLLASLERRADEEGQETASPLSVRQSPRVSEEERPRWLTEGLPNVSATRAKALLEEFGSFYEIATANREELQVVDGIGEKTADQIYHALRRRHDPASLG